jgi:hydroxymethylbilane synthase
VSATPPTAAVILGTRASKLARAQTDSVVELLAAAWPGLSCDVRPMVTQGDRTQASGEPLPEIGGKGLFTLELERALRDGEIDLAVHSLKDLPTEDSSDIAIGAICLREDARDCLVARDGLTLAELPRGSVVGTSSLRREAQLRAQRPDLEIRSIRGNVDTRIDKVRRGEYDATVLAAAGIRRLGLETAVTEWLEPEAMLPAPGQGALAVQCRADDAHVLELVAAIDDPASRVATMAERAFLRELGGGCAAPVAAHAEMVVARNDDDASNSLLQGGLRVRMSGLVASIDGSEVVRVRSEGEPEELGGRLAREALAAGGAVVLEAIRLGGNGVRPHGSDPVPTLPLEGTRIVVTRPESRPLAEALEGLGAEVSIVPLIEIRPVEDPRALDAAAGELATYDWVVFTSVNGVAAVGERLSGIGQTRVAAVGPVTADSVRELGVEPAFVAARASEDIAAGLGSIADARVLLPQADIADPRLAEELRERGATVDVVVAYRTIQVEPALWGMLPLRIAHAIVLASGSAVRSLSSIAGSLEGLGSSTLLVCIGPRTAAVAREVGLPVGLVADETTADGIIRALVSHFGESS